MRPIKVSIQAFGSYNEKQVIDFTVPTQNLFLITGETGAGKTTVFDAIAFALYGETSSGEYARSGVELQSQFSAPDKVPTVELTFEEGSELYTVKRSPAYMRLKQRGSGLTKEGSSVSLTMPDGLPYAYNNDADFVNRKLIELVGLTKSQFMQVAMIAQGEFVALLRTKSEDRKEIFRKLFGTGKYKLIVNELNDRVNAKQKDIARIATEYKTLAAGVRVPAGCAEEEEMNGLKKRFSEKESVSVVDLERFSELLGPICEELEKSCLESEKLCAGAAKERDAKRDIYKNAAELLPHFESLEKAKKALAECEAEKDEIAASEKLAAEITAAYEVKAVGTAAIEAAKSFEDTKAELAAEKEKQPVLAGNCQKADKAEAEAKAAEDKAHGEFERLSAEVKSALELFSRIDEAAKEVGLRQGRLKKAEADEVSAGKALKAYEEKTAALQKRSGELEGTAAAIARFEASSEALEKAAKDLSDAKKLEKEVGKLRRTAEEAAAGYAAAKRDYSAARAEADTKQQIFLDEQAGFIAMKQLREGEPCPVCGSTEHPAPCKVSDELSSLSAELINELNSKAEELKNRQEKLAESSGSAAASLKERTERLCEATRSVSEQLGRIFKSVNGEITLGQAEQAVSKGRASLSAELAKLRAAQSELDGIRKELSGSEDKLRALHENRSSAQAELAAAKTALENSIQNRDALERDRKYDSADAARARLAEAKTEYDKAVGAHSAAEKARRLARSEAERSEALIARLEGQLPAMEQAAKTKDEEYKELLEVRGIGEQQWKSITEKYSREKADELQKRITAHKDKLGRAETAAGIEEGHIKGRAKPDSEKLRSEADAAEQALDGLTKRHNDLKAMSDTDRQVLDQLAPKLEERQKISREHALLRSLHDRLSSKTLDIESYVQRWHLEQVLIEANRRFLEMSGGQFELRMCDEDFLNAADGRKHHGLELMVYSTVTGKLREVSTLSGGESFLAALSLALGMADRIKEQSSAVNLDILFIDEGFGSLSDNARSQAVKILKQMAGGSKLIGLISHVSELKTEIDDRLVVTKTDKGSSVHWSVG